jgi:hypothetical protein
MFSFPLSFFARPDNVGCQFLSLSLSLSRSLFLSFNPLSYCINALYFTRMFLLPLSFSAGLDNVGYRFHRRQRHHLRSRRDLGGRELRVHSVNLKTVFFH